MAVFEVIDRGLVANDGTGDNAREWARKTNDNFAKSANLGEINTFTEDQIIQGSELRTLTLKGITGNDADVSKVIGVSDVPGRQTEVVFYRGSTSNVMGVRIDTYNSVVVNCIDFEPAGTIVAAPTYDNTSAAAADLGIGSGGRIFRSTSSEKIKKDIKENVDSDLVLKLKPVTFIEKSTNEKHIGFVAEQVGSIDSRFATNLDSELPGLNINAILSAAVAKIQDLETRLAKLEK